MIYVITGPTCTGKSDAAIQIAKTFNAEIINADAFQVYKELNIGVAKPTLDQLSKVSHHLFSYVSCDEEYSIARYQIDLRSKIEELTKKGKNIVLVGGSGLYIRAGLFDYSLEQNENCVDMGEYEALSNEELFKELEKIDPNEARKLHPNNRRRVLRAIQIYLTQGKQKSEIVLTQNHKPIYNVRFFAKDIEREYLYSLINKRVDKMFEDGLCKEVENLFNKYGSNKQSLQAIGYKEFVHYFEGKMTLEEVKELIKKNTRNYAKRQITFIKHQFNIEYFKDVQDLKELINQ